MENNKQDDRRISPRISRNFIIKHRPHTSEDLPWDICFVRNISLKGCYCSSDKPYEEGQILDIQIQLPAFKEPLQLGGEVKRCDFDKNKPAAICFIAVEFIQMDEQQKHILSETVAFFLHQKNN